MNRSRDAKRTKYMMIGVFFSNLILQVMFILSNTACFDCNIMHVARDYVSRLSTKGINLVFLIHRASLVQGMSPILGKVWFEKILPTVVMLFTLVFIVGGIRNTMKLNMKCYAYSDNDSLGFCLGHPSEQKESLLRTIREWDWALISLDAGIVTFLMILFVVPLYRVYNQDLGRMNANQLRQRMKLWRLLVWSVVLTLINQISTSALLLIRVSYPPYPPLHALAGLVGKLDPSTNVWSSWLMLNRNRQYLQSICCCGGATKHRNQELSRGMTNLHSANNVRTFQSKSTIQLSSIEVTAVSQNS